MKKYGKIIEYDGYNGRILSEDGLEYIMLNIDTKDEINYNVGDIVSFVPEYKEMEEYKTLLARFVEKK